MCILNASGAYRLTAVLCRGAQSFGESELTQPQPLQTKGEPGALEVLPTSTLVLPLQRSQYKVHKIQDVNVGLFVHTPACTFAYVSFFVCAWASVSLCVPLSGAKCTFESIPISISVENWEASYEDESPELCLAFPPLLCDTEATRSLSQCDGRHRRQFTELHKLHSTSAFESNHLPCMCPVALELLINKITQHSTALLVTGLSICIWLNLHTKGKEICAWSAVSLFWQCFLAVDLVQLENLFNFPFKWCHICQEHECIWGAAAVYVGCAHENWPDLLCQPQSS